MRKRRRRPTRWPPGTSAWVWLGQRRRRRQGGRRMRFGRAFFKRHRGKQGTQAAPGTRRPRCSARRSAARRARGALAPAHLSSPGVACHKWQGLRPALPGARDSDTRLCVCLRWGGQWASETRAASGSHARTPTARTARGGRGRLPRATRSGLHPYHTPFARPCWAHGALGMAGSTRGQDCWPII